MMMLSKVFYELDHQLFSRFGESTHKMKIRNLIILFYFSASINLFAQRVLIPSDSTISVTLNSTGYTEIHPHDVPDESGLFIYTADGREALRIYGSFRLLLTWDDKKNFHPFDLTQPTIPTGVNDFYYPNSQATINMSRLGFDAMIARNKSSDLLIRIELDWKGDNEKFRIRHLYLRSEHWLVGKSWSSFNNVAYLTQAVDGRLTGGAVGVRPVQIRYYNQTEKWSYQFSAEYQKPTLIQPDTLGAQSDVIFPGFTGNVSYKTNSFDIMLAGVLRINRVQFTSDYNGSQSETGYGGLVAAKIHLNKKNRFMMSATGGMGIGGLMGDFAFVDIDLAFNPDDQKFENMGAFTAFLGYEHDWSDEFTSAIGGSILGSEEKSFFDGGYFKSGSKVLTNLFYKPSSKFGAFSVGVEVEYAERKNITSPSNNTIRVSSLVIYNF